MGGIADSSAKAAHDLYMSKPNITARRSTVDISYNCEDLLLKPRSPSAHRRRKNDVVAGDTSDVDDCDDHAYDANGDGGR